MGLGDISGFHPSTKRGIPVRIAPKKFRIPADWKMWITSAWVPSLSGPQHVKTTWHSTSLLDLTHAPLPLYFRPDAEEWSRSSGKCHMERNWEIIVCSRPVVFSKVSDSARMHPHWLRPYNNNNQTRWMHPSIHSISLKWRAQFFLFFFFLGSTNGDPLDSGRSKKLPAAGVLIPSGRGGGLLQIRQFDRCHQLRPPIGNPFLLCSFSSPFSTHTDV